MSKKSKARKQKRNEQQGPQMGTMAITAFQLSDIPGFVDTLRKVQGYCDRIDSIKSSSVRGVLDMEFPTISENLHIQFEFTPTDDTEIVNISGSTSPDDLSEEAYAFEGYLIEFLGACSGISREEAAAAFGRLDECIKNIFLERAAASFSQTAA